MRKEQCLFLITFQTTSSMIISTMNTILRQPSYTHPIASIKHNSRNNMLSFERAAQLEVKQSIPQQLQLPVFGAKDELWVKQSHNPNFQSSQVTSKRFQYIKIGKTFGLEITRYLTFFQGHLLYYDGETDQEFKGYCYLQNVYVQWLSLTNGRHLLYLTNGAQTRQFFFPDDQFWRQFEIGIAQVAIQLNFKDKYDVNEQVGKGSFSKVFHVTHSQSKQEFAAKIINKRDKNKSCTRNLVLEQRKILRLIQSKYVYKFHEMYEEQQSYVMILDYLPGEDLMAVYKEKKITNLALIIKLLRQVVEGVRDIHNAGIIHRDLKPQNIQVDLETLKPHIIDFGLSLCIDSTISPRRFKRCGTMGYMAPEVIESADNQKKKAYGTKADIFSLGIICHMLLVGKNPLKGRDYEQTFLRNKVCEIDLNKAQINQQNGDHCFMFLTKMLAKYPEFRFNAEQALNSPFLTQKLEEKAWGGERDKEDSSSTVEEKYKIHKPIPTHR